MKDIIESGKTALGIEFGSTKIKAVLIDENNNLIATSGHKWENKYENGVWTYSLDDIWTGLQDCYSKLAATVKEKYDAEITKIGAMGFSAMMHGYMAFDKDDTLLVPFRTWRNTITSEASDKLTEVFDFNIPQRWSIAHLYQAILNKEEHVKDIDFITFASSAGVKGFFESGKTIPSTAKAVCIGKYTAKTLEEYGINNYITAKTASADSMAEAILNEVTNKCSDSED